MQACKQVNLCFKSSSAGHWTVHYSRLCSRQNTDRDPKSWALVSLPPCWVLLCLIDRPQSLLFVVVAPVMLCLRLPECEREVVAVKTDWCLNVQHSYSILFVIAGPLFRSPCELLPVGMGHPVQATLKSFTALSGCASRGTTSLPQEVHIINLRGHAAEGPHNTPAGVSHL